MDKVITFIFENASLIIAVTVVIAVFFILLLIVRASAKSIRNKELEIAHSFATPRLYIIDFAKHHIVFFNRGDYSKRKEGSYQLFFAQFLVKDHDPLSLWLESLLDEEALVPTFYEIDVFVRSEKKTYRSLLRIVKVDYERKIIHLESFLYRHLLPEKQIGRTRDEIKQLKTRSTHIFGNSLFRRLKDKGLGVFAAFSLINTNVHISESEEVDYHLFLKLKDIISVYVTKNQLFFTDGKMKAGLYFTKTDDVNFVYDVMDKIKAEFSSYSEINGYLDVSIALAISNAKHFKDYNLFIKTTYELASYAHRRNEKVIFYDPEADLKEFDITLFRKDLEKVIAERKFTTYFQPLVNSLSAEVYGYITTYVPANSLFKSYLEIKNYARAVKLNSSLFIVFARNAMAQFYNKRRSSKHVLFLPMMMSDHKYVVEALKGSPLYADIPLALLINEENISDFSGADDFHDVVEILKALSDKEVPLALIINDTELTLPDELYAHFNYFIVDEKIMKKTVGNERERLYLLASLGKLLRHKQPIIITDIPKWTEIEYYIRAGANYVASDEICQKDPVPLPIDKRKALRIINFNKRK